MSQILDNLSLPFASRKQAAILWYLTTNRTFFEHAKNKLKPAWFTDAIVSKVYSALLEFANNPMHPRMPSKVELLESRGFMVEEPAVRSAMRATVEMAYNEAQVYGLDVLKGELTEWLHAYIYKEGIETATHHFQQQRFSEAYKIVAERIKLIQETKFDDDYEFDFSNLAESLADSEARVLEGCTFGLKMVDDALTPGGVTTAGGLFRRDTTCLMAPVNVGKCVRRDTPIIMFDGAIKKVQDIRKGDLLMGPDGKSRAILSTTRGRGQMYDIIPKSGGEVWGCNDAHILNLKCAINRAKNTPRRAHNRKYVWGATENISVSDYLKTNKEYKYNMRLWRTGLDFAEKSLLIPPYILGLWLGDGHSATAALTSMDEPLVREWESWVLSKGDQVRVYSIGKQNRAKTYRAASQVKHRRGVCVKELMKLGVLHNKRIPREYLTSSRNQRLALLAGLIDTDGWNNKPSRCYELTTVSPQLAQDYAFLARSLGFKVTVTTVKKSSQNGAEGTYFQAIIRGSLSQVPVRLARKAALDSKKDPGITGFTVKDTGIGDYYGFTLDGDGLFLLGDFTVTHNTTAMLSTVAANIMSNRRVLLLIHEGEPTDIRDKLLMNMLDVTKPKLWSMRLSPEGRASLACMEAMLKQGLTFVPYIKAQMTIEDVIPIIRQKCEEAIAEGKPYDLLADDYPELLLSEYARAARMEDRTRIAGVYLIFTQLASEFNLHALVNIQTNRAGSVANRDEDRLLGKEDVAESWGAMAKMTNVITVNRSLNDQNKNRLTYYIVKSRSSGTGRAVVARTNFDNAIAHSDRDGYGAVWYFGSKMIPGEELDQYLPMCAGGEITAARMAEAEALQQAAKAAKKADKE